MELDSGTSEDMRLDEFVLGAFLKPEGLKFEAEGQDYGKDSWGCQRSLPARLGILVRFVISIY